MRTTITSIALLIGNRASAQPADEDKAKITVGGYFEEYYQLDAQDPSNRLTNLRGFDNRSRTFTLSNVALEIKGDIGPATGHIIVQWGHTPSTYYLAEPVSPGTPSVDTSDGELWKYVQTATVSAKKSDFVVEAGLFPSPIGPEVFAVKDNWNWSRSNLFFGLPFYHTGATVSHPLGGEWIGKLHVYNGWNSVVDNNGTPSVAVSAGYNVNSTFAQVLYFGGIERPDGSPEGQPWRNLFDAYVQFPVNEVVSLGAQVDAGFEPNRIGTSWWAAGALYAKLAVTDELYAAVRGDYFREHRAENGTLVASPIFWPVEWVAEGTATLAYQPIDHASIRLEYRHDHAADDAYFGGDVVIVPATLTAIPNRTMQDTVTLGVTAWF
ncbi:MAG: porin [Kofleriaceae bacterium]|nr:porin [Kofleriaceae bacterium]